MIFVRGANNPSILMQRSKSKGLHFSNATQFSNFDNPGTPGIGVPFDVSLDGKCLLVNHADEEMQAPFQLVTNLALPKRFLENYGMHQERGKESIVHIVRMYAGHDLNHLGQVENIKAATGTV